MTRARRWRWGCHVRSRRWRLHRQLHHRAAPSRSCRSRRWRLHRQLHHRASPILSTTRIAVSHRARHCRRSSLQAFCRTASAPSSVAAPATDPHLFYIGVALNARQRWSCPWIGHNQHYRRLVVLASAPSSVTLRLEVRLIEAFRGHADLVNRAPGGGGLSPCHPTSCVYVAIGGDSSRRVLASAPKGRKRKRWCSNVLCDGRCQDCVW